MTIIKQFAIQKWVFRSKMGGAFNKWVHILLPLKKGVTVSEMLALVHFGNNMAHACSADVYIFIHTCIWLFKHCLMLLLIMFDTRMSIITVDDYGVFVSSMNLFFFFFFFFILPITSLWGSSVNLLSCSCLIVSFDVAVVEPLACLFVYNRVVWVCLFAFTLMGIVDLCLWSLLIYQWQNHCFSCNNYNNDNNIVRRIIIIIVIILKHM